MTKRLTKRGETSGRVDDNSETIKLRLKTFHKETEPVIEYYAKQGKLTTVSAEANPDQVFGSIQAVFDKVEGFSFDEDRHIDSTPLKDAKVIFLVGGPGSGKGTQCEKLVQKYGYTHISSGDLLRAEVGSGSERGKKLNKLMKRGLLVPNKVVLDMIKETMLEKKSTSKGFLVDGYPRAVNQGIEFETEIVPCAFVISVEASDETMTQRLLKRGQTSGRADDNEETIRARLKLFHETTQPVCDYYEKQGKLERIDADRDPNSVFADIKRLVDKRNRESKIAFWKDHMQEFDATVNNIVNIVIDKASHRQEVTNNVALSIQTALKDVIGPEMEPDEDSGYAFLEYDHLQIYQGPCTLMHAISATDASGSDSAIKHGEIIIRVTKGQDIAVRADENTDTIISNVDNAEIIIRNVDTNILLNIGDQSHFNHAVELSVVGQAYFKDISGSFKAKQFRGIVVIRSDL